MNTICYAHCEAGQLKLDRHREKLDRHREKRRRKLEGVAWRGLSAPIFRRYFFLLVPSAFWKSRLDLVEKPHLFVVFVIEKVLKHVLLSPKPSDIHKKSIHFRDLVFFSNFM